MLLINIQSLTENQVMSIFEYIKGISLTRLQINLEIINEAFDPILMCNVIPYEFCLETENYVLNSN